MTLAILSDVIFGEKDESQIEAWIQSWFKYRCLSSFSDEVQSDDADWSDAESWNKCKRIHHAVWTKRRHQRGSTYSLLGQDQRSFQT